MVRGGEERLFDLLVDRLGVLAFHDGGLHVPGELALDYQDEVVAGLDKVEGDRLEGLPWLGGQLRRDGSTSAVAFGLIVGTSPRRSTTP